MASRYCFLDGKYLEESKTSLGIKDIGLLRGFGVFEFWRTYNGKGFLMTEHLERLFNSAKQLGIEMPYSKEQIEEIITKLLKLNNKSESTIRAVLTGGLTDDGMYPSGQPTFLVMTKDLPALKPEIYKAGVKILTDEYYRHLPLVKHLDYSNLVKNQNRLKKENAFNLLYVYQDRILEAAISNFFLIKDSILITPKDGVMMGTIRNLIIKLAKDIYHVEEREIAVTELDSADECFLTGTTQGVLPVVAIDNKIISTGKPGKITNNLIDIFNQYVEANYY